MRQVPMLGMCPLVPAKVGDQSVGRNRFIAPVGEAVGAIKRLRPTNYSAASVRALRLGSRRSSTGLRNRPV